MIRLLIRLLVAAAAVVLVVRLGAWLFDTVPQGPLAQRHAASAKHSPENTLQAADSALPFTDYVVNVRNMVAGVVLSTDSGPGTGKADALEKKKLEANPFLKAQIDASTPFDEPAVEACGESRGGALLIHGLTDTPFLMRDIAQRLRRQPTCLHVRSLLLPGHGTRPGDLLNVEWRQWRDAVAYGINSFRGKTRKLYLVGFSTGGALSIYHAFRQSEVAALSKNEMELKGLILLSPAVEVASPLAILARAHNVYSWLPFWREGEWDDLANDLDYSKYESFPKNAGWQIYRLTRQLADLPATKAEIPAIVAASIVDTTIAACGTVEFFSRRFKSEQSRLILYREAGRESEKTPCDATIGKEKDRITSVSVASGQLLDMAHISVPVSPDNPHYGRNGDYANCVHYDNGHPKKSDAAKYAACKAPIASTSPANAWSGELTDENLGKGVLRRLSYNPRFEELATHIQEFVGRTIGR